jgi:hypothetical protein
MLARDAQPVPRLLRAALAAARSGLYVFPIRPVGIATGPSRLLVVDLDTARDTTPPQWAAARGGNDVLRMLATDAGQPSPAARSP